MGRKSPSCVRSEAMCPNLIRCVWFGFKRKNESFSSEAAAIIFSAMKRQVILCALLAGFTSAVPQLRAQDTPATVAERQEAEERYKRMSAEIEDLKTANQSYQLRLNELREEIRRLTEE